MKIAVLGTGGVGGYYGGLLAKQGHEVSFIARGAHLEAIRRDGLQIRSVHGDFSIQPARAFADPAQIGPVDLVLFCTKTYDTERAAESIRPLITQQTTILSFQNGVDSAERIGAILGMSHLMGAATWISSAIEAPGVIRQVSAFRRIVFGELDGSISPRAKSISELFSPTGITVEISSEIVKVLWTKFLFIAAASGVGSLTRLPMGEYRSVPETRRVLTSLMGEIGAVARAQNIILDTDVVEKTLAFIDASAPTIVPSMQRDFETGHISELEAVIGVICRKGRELGVPTPIADLTYAILLPVEQKARQKQTG